MCSDDFSNMGKVLESPGIAAKHNNLWHIRYQLTIDKQKAFGLKSEPRATGTPTRSTEVTLNAFLNY